MALGHYVVHVEISLHADSGEAAEQHVFAAIDDLLDHDQDLSGGGVTGSHGPAPETDCGECAMADDEDAPER